MAFRSTKSSVLFHGKNPLQASVSSIVRIDEAVERVTTGNKTVVAKPVSTLASNVGTPLFSKTSNVSEETLNHQKMNIIFFTKHRLRNVVQVIPQSNVMNQLTLLQIGIMR